MNTIKCPVCEKNNFKQLVYLKDFPISNLGLSASKKEALKYKRYDMNIVFCKRCSHIYNNIPIKLEYKQKSNTTYFTNEKQREYIKELANTLLKKFSIINKNILEIGSGDSLFLKEISKNKNRCIGYEPSYKKIYKKKNITIINDYFIADKNNLKNIDWIIIRHVLEHFENPYNFMLNIIKNLILLNSDCKFFIEVPNIEPTINEARINDFIHEHISHFSIHSLKYLLYRLNLNIIDIYTTQNEENIVAICNIDKNYTLAFNNVNNISSILDSSIKSLQKTYKKLIKDNKNIAIWGAEGRGASLINIIKNYLKGNEIIVDSDSRKFGKFIPSIGLQIFDFKILKSKKIDALIITTFIGKDNILKEINKYDIKIKNIYVLSKKGLKKVKNEKN